MSVESLNLIAIIVMSLGVGYWNNNSICNIQWKRFILQDIQGHVNKGTWLASFIRNKTVHLANTVTASIKIE